MTILLSPSSTYGFHSILFYNLLWISKNLFTSTNEFNTSKARNQRLHKMDSSFVNIIKKSIYNISKWISLIKILMQYVKKERNQCLVSILICSSLKSIKMFIISYNKYFHSFIYFSICRKKGLNIFLVLAIMKIFAFSLSKKFGSIKTSFFVTHFENVSLIVPMTIF